MVPNKRTYHSFSSLLLYQISQFTFFATLKILLHSEEPYTTRRERNRVEKNLRQWTERITRSLYQPSTATFRDVIREWVFKKRKESFEPTRFLVSIISYCLPRRRCVGKIFRRRKFALHLVKFNWSYLVREQLKAFEVAEYETTGSTHIKCFSIDSKILKFNARSNRQHDPTPR